MRVSIKGKLTTLGTNWILLKLCSSLYTNHPEHYGKPSTVSRFFKDGIVLKSEYHRSPRLNFTGAMQLQHVSENFIWWLFYVYVRCEDMQYVQHHNRRECAINCQIYDCHLFGFEGGICSICKKTTSDAPEAVPFPPALDDMYEGMYLRQVISCP